MCGKEFLQRQIFQLESIKGKSNGKLVQLELYVRFYVVERMYIVYLIDFGLISIIRR